MKYYNNLWRYIMLRLIATKDRKTVAVVYGNIVADMAEFLPVWRSHKWFNMYTTLEYKSLEEFLWKSLEENDSLFQWRPWADHYYVPATMTIRHNGHEAYSRFIQNIDCTYTLYTVYEDLTGVVANFEDKKAIKKWLKEQGIK